MFLGDRDSLSLSLLIWGKHSAWALRAVHEIHVSWTVAEAFFRNFNFNAGRIGITYMILFLLEKDTDILRSQRIIFSILHKLPHSVIAAAWWVKAHLWEGVSGSVVRLRIQTLTYWSPKTVTLCHIRFYKRNIISFAETGSGRLDLVVPKLILPSFMAIENIQSKEADWKITTFWWTQALCRELLVPSSSA